MVNGKRLQRHIIKIQTPFNNENGYIVVLASPWYYRHISGFLKNAFDPLFAVAECDNYKNPVKDRILIMMAKVLDLKKAKSGMTIWKSIGKIFCSHVTQPEYTEGKGELKQAYELGKSLK